MPELPEVETVRTGLDRSISGCTITGVVLRRANLRFVFPQQFAETLKNRTINTISRRAKYLLFHLDNDAIIIAHLGMTGRFSVLESAPENYEKHDHVIFHLNDGRVLIYNDARRFGYMAYCLENTLPEHPLIAKLGPEPLSADFTPAYLKKSLLKKHGPIKPAIMDQQLVVGVGNIYASEALYLSKINPLTPANLVAPKAKSLVNSIQAVLKSAIISGGSSLRDFVQVSGESGYFQHHFNVYGRENEPCQKCFKEIQLVKQAGRSSFYCPSCQKAVC